VHGVDTAGTWQTDGSAAFVLFVLNFRVPPVMLNPPSKTTFPSRNSTLVPLPIESPPLQSTTQFPDTLIVPDGLHENDAFQLWYAVPIPPVTAGNPFVPMAAFRLSM